MNIFSDCFKTAIYRYQQGKVQVAERLEKLQKELTQKANNKQDYDAIADEIFQLRDMRKQSEVDSVVRDEQMKQISDLQDFIKAQPTDITKFDETLVKRLIAKITVRR